MRPIVIFILGIEGSGHHMINAYLEAANINFETYLPKITRETSFDFEKTFMNYVSNRPFTIITTDSFPGGRPAHSENHPSISTIMKLPIDLRLVRLHRYPPDAVCSAHRRFGPDIITLARIAKDSMAILNQYSADETIIFERAIRNVSYVVEKLNRILNGTHHSVGPIKSHTPNHYDCPHRQWIERYLN